MEKTAPACCRKRSPPSAQARSLTPPATPTKRHSSLPAHFSSCVQYRYRPSAGALGPRSRGGARRGGAGRGGAGPHLRSTPPRSDALRHSGGERRRCTSATVTLYFEVELRSDRRPGTEQKTSLGFTTPPKRLSLLIGMAETALLLDLDRDTGPAKTDAGACGVRTD